MKNDAKFNEIKKQREKLHKELLPMRKELLRMKKQLNIKDSPSDDVRSRPHSSSGSLPQTSPASTTSSESNDENHSFQDMTRSHKRLKVEDHRFDDNNNNSDSERRKNNVNGHTLVNGIKSTLLAV